ncbi:MAG: flagellar filament outer layer protein FlaA [Spirochaetaceae bacterium]|jgi:hypothetical protein|nr:flagellar filament outer layer protein FlaA [Spirochaetaceae bacterium]
MKRLFVFVAFTLAAVGTLVADESVLIDFSNLVPDILLDQPDVLPQNRQTTMDFSNTAGAHYTADQRSMMRTSLAIPNWKVELAPSSRTVLNDVNSYTKVSASQQYTNVMGTRIHFPEAAYNSWALIRPPFDIPAYEFSESDGEGNITISQPDNFTTTPSRFENGYGVIKNVGAVKSLQVTVYGINAPHSLSAILIDGSGRSQTIFLGYLNFDGWADLSWDNPQYINEVRSRSLRIYQLYPKDAPYVRFGGFIIQRDGSNVGGDFVAYFKDVRLVYDKANLEAENDIDDESEWDVIKEREAERQKIEFTNFGKDQVWRYLENEKKAPETYFTDPGRVQAQDNAGAANNAAAAQQ